MLLKNNLSNKERLIRITTGIALSTMSYHNIMVSGMYDIVFGFLGLYLSGTSILSHCPLYKSIKFSTKK